LAGKTSNQAVKTFLEPIRQAISCLTKHVVTASGFDPNNGRPHVLTINNGDPVKLSSSDPISFTFQMQYRIVEAEGERGQWKVKTAGYNYSIQDESEQEILGYHWHPNTVLAYPHLHICSASGVNLLRKIHLPTGRISVEDVLQLLIEQFKVRPIRQDWQKVLKRTKAGYEKFRTWS
jgi:hypothetical protein